MNLLKTLLVLLVASLLETVYASDDIKNVANEVQQELYKLLENTTNFTYLMNNAKLDPVTSISLKKRNGTDIIQQATNELTTLFNVRLSTVKELAEYAEKQYENYTTDYSLDSNYEYFDARQGDSDLVGYDEQFSEKVEVNLNMSVVQTPTDLYQYAIKVVNSIEWTKTLDKKFKENFNKIETKYKAWHYIGLTNGVFRTYPASLWSKNVSKSPLRYFDVRQRPWYIEGSSSPKDMVIILDLSGSVIGNRFLIIKLAVMTLLDTLQENDFVNIIYFNKEAYYVKKSWPLLVQATERNKKILKEAIQTLSGKKTANVDTGFKLAFKILQDSRDNSTNHTSKCTQSIAFFTDGVEGDTVAEDVFSDYNSKKKVRVFTYLVGREKGTPFKAVKWIACTNKGYFYRIETLSDVRMNIVKYVNILSRSIIQRKPKWTPLYLDAQGLGMMTALVAPIFDTTDASVTRGKQLGVVGIDVTLEEIMSKIPDYKLGVGGYAFAITNNGFIFFHPRMRGMTGDNLKNPHSILLSEVERHFDEDGFIKELMEAMINKEKGSKNTKNVDNYILAKYNEKFIIVKRKLKYFYDHITNTSFSVGIALKDPGLQSINPGDDVFNGVASLKQLTGNVNYNISAANWSYCETDVAVENWQELWGLLKEKNADDLKKCANKELMKLLLYDLKKMQNWEPTMSPNVSAVFVGTMSGLTFFKSKNDITFGNPIKQEYFERAADDWKKIVFSVHGNEVRASKVVPIDVSGEKAVWGVAGVQLLHESIQSILKKSTSSKCYLVDENGYIIVSGQETNITGEFLGKVEGLVMKDLIDKGIFIKYNFVDVQGACKVNTDSSSSIRILDPLFALVNFAKWWTKTVALSFIQYSLYSIMTGMNQVKADDADDVSEISCFKKMDLYIRNVSDFGVVRNESLNGFQYSYESHMVKDTNLMLILVNKTQFDKKVSNDAVEIDCAVDEGECELRNNYRQLPEEPSGCVPHPDEITECNAGKSLLPSLLLVLLQVIIFLKCN